MSLVEEPINSELTPLLEGDTLPPESAADDVKDSSSVVNESQQRPLSGGTIDWNTRARHFAVSLIQRLETYMKELEDKFSQAAAGGWSAYAFVMMLAEFILNVTAREEAAGGIDDGVEWKQRWAARPTGGNGNNAGNDYVLAGSVPVHCRADICAKVSSATYLASCDGAELKERVKYWEGLMRRRCHKIAQGEVAPSEDAFGSVVDLEFSLFHLFRAVDHTATGRVTWDTFLAYMFDSVMKGKAGTASHDDIRPYSFVNRAAPSAFRRAAHIRHDSRIACVVVHRHEKDRHSLCFVDDGNMRTPREKELKVPVAHGYLICFEVVPSHELIVVSTADAHVRIFDLSTQQCKMHKRCAVSVTKVKWNVRQRRLYCGLRNGSVQVWDISRCTKQLEFDRRVPLEPVIEVCSEPHTDAVTDMLFLPFDGHLVTSSLDSHIKCLNVRTLRVMRTLSGHGKGVNHITYSHQYNMLVSAGHDYCPLCWATNVPSSKFYRLRDGNKPHSSRIVGIHLVQSTPQCVSCDTQGLIKIWDIRTMQCVQTLCCEPGRGKDELTAMQFHTLAYHTGKKQLLVCARRKAYLFQYNVRDRNMSSKTAMDFAIVGTWYNPRQGALYTCSRKDLRSWDLLSGSPVLIAIGVVREDIVSIAVDREGRKCYLGCFDGSVAAVSTTQGSVTGRVTLPSCCEVVALAQIPRTPYLLCVTQDGVVSVLVDRDGHLTTEPFVPAASSSTVGRFDIKTVVVHEGRGVFLLGEGQNCVSVWKLAPITTPSQPPQWVKECDCRSNPLTSEITCVLPLPGLPCFVSADCSGGVHAWTLPGKDVRKPYSCLSRWVNHHPGKVNGPAYVPAVSCLAFHPGLCLLYAADDIGMVNVYAMREGMQHAGMLPGEKAAKNSRWKRLGRSARGDNQHSVLIQSWRSHSDGVTSIAVLEKPCCVLTTGYDCQVILWTLWGRKISYLSKKGVPSGYLREFEAARAEGRVDDVYNDVPWPHNKQAQQSAEAATLAHIAGNLKSRADASTTLQQVLQLGSGPQAERARERLASAAASEPQVPPEAAPLSFPPPLPAVCIPHRLCPVGSVATAAPVSAVSVDEEGTVLTPAHGQSPRVRKEPHAFYQSYLAAKTPPTAEQYVRDPTCASPPPPPPLPPPSDDSREAAAAPWDARDFLRVTQTRAVAQQRRARTRADTQARSRTKVAPPSGYTAAAAPEGGLRAATVAFVRCAPPPVALSSRSTTAAASGRLQLRPLRAPPPPPRQRPTPEPSDFATDDALDWHASGMNVFVPRATPTPPMAGDGIAMRRLHGQGQPYSKSWLVT